MVERRDFVGRSVERRGIKKVVAEGGSGVKIPESYGERNDSGVGGEVCR